MPTMSYPPKRSKLGYGLADELSMRKATAMIKVMKISNFGDDMMEIDDFFGKFIEGCMKWN